MAKHGSRNDSRRDDRRRGDRHHDDHRHQYDFYIASSGGGLPRRMRSLP